MCEPSCEKIKKMFAGALQREPCGSSLSLLISCCLHLNASSHTHYYIKEWIKKIPQDAGLIPGLSVLTVRLSSLLSPQPHSTICKSSGPQWNRLTAEEEHQVNLRTKNVMCVPSGVSCCVRCLLRRPRGVSGQRWGSAGEQLMRTRCCDASAGWSGVSWRLKAASHSEGDASVSVLNVHSVAGST